jgi:hypothetical protein
VEWPNTQKPSTPGDGDDGWPLFGHIGATFEHYLPYLASSGGWCTGTTETLGTTEESSHSKGSNRVGVTGLEPVTPAL